MSHFDDDVIGKRLVHQIQEEALANQSIDGAFWVVVADSGLTLHAKTVGGCRPTPEQMTFARFACTTLNRRYRFGGTWIVVWCERRTKACGTPTRLVFMWKDPDGDVPIAFDTVKPVEDLVTWGPVWFCESAERAFVAYREHLKAIGVKPEQMIKAAQGQTSVDPTAAPSYS
jgi:hypothetical protein